MLQPWQALRSWFAGVGSDPYYANYDRSLGNIKAELDRIQVGCRAVGFCVLGICLGPLFCLLPAWPMASTRVPC
jgi:hypothetical protein